MVKFLARYAKNIAPMLVCSVLLLAVQAWGDLSLPSLMSDIVDAGIQLRGVDSVIPIKLRADALAQMADALPADSRAAVLDAYDVSGGIASLKKISKGERAELERIFSGVIRAAAASRGVSLDGMAENAVIAAAAPIYIQLYQDAGVNTDKLQTDYILKAGLKMAGFSLLIMAAVIAAAFFGARIAANVARRARRDVFRQAVGFSNAEFDSFSTASLITRSTNDVQQIQQMLPMLLRVVIYAPIMGIGGIIKVMRTEISMTWIIAVAVAVLMCVILAVIALAMPRFKQMQKIVDKVNLIMREALSGMLVIRAFNTQKHEAGRFDKANRELTGVNVFVGRLMSSLFPVIMLLMNGVTLLIVWVGAGKIASAEIQIGDMMAFIQYAMQVIMSFLFISVMAFMLPRASVAAGRILEVLNKGNTVLDPEKPESLGKVKGEVTFEGVSFRYPNAEDDVLKDISFTARPGTTTAFIGSTGSGKSTLVNLIPRFYDITGGRLLIDGKDIRRVTRAELRGNIGYIPQKGALFTGTIESNIKFAGGVDDESMIKAARIAQAEDFIEEKSGKYNEPVSQGGQNVSGGQRQRLAVARALAKNPPIYIFDDSFSALDYKTDAALRAAIAKEAKGAAVLIVAQRIGTIKNADQIIVLDEGAVVGVGTHDDLLKNCEVYRQIALSQLSEEELGLNGGEIA
jgi:ATP-binding cassette subfamily B protein